METYDKEDEFEKVQTSFMNLSSSSQTAKLAPGGVIEHLIAEEELPAAELTSSESEFNEQLLRRRNRCSILDKSIREKLEIGVGPQHQAELPQFLHVLQHDNVYPDRDECFWRSEEGDSIKNSELDEFINAAGIQTDQAMMLLMSSNLSLRESLGKIEKHVKSLERKKWRSVERKNFITLINRIGKNFVRMSRMLGNRTPKECVEMYYQMKMKRCLTSNSATFVQCSNIRMCSPDQIPKSTCQNCSQMLWRNPLTVSACLAKTKDLPLCPACELFARKFGVHRPGASNEVELEESDDADAGERKDSACLLSPKSSTSERRKAPMAFYKGMAKPANSEAVLRILRKPDGPDFLRNRQKYRLDYISASLGDDSNSRETSSRNKRIVPSRSARNAEMEGPRRRRD